MIDPAGRVHNLASRENMILSAAELRHLNLHRLRRSYRTSSPVQVPVLPRLLSCQRAYLQAAKLSRGEILAAPLP